MNETPIEEIPTYDHEETIGNDDTIDEEEKQNGMVIIHDSSIMTHRSYNMTHRSDEKCLN